MYIRRRSTRTLMVLVMLASMAGVVGFTVPGCYRVEGKRRAFAGRSGQGEGSLQETIQ